MRLSNFLHIVVSLTLMLAFIGLPVTKGYCDMANCVKECKAKCCDNPPLNNACKQNTEYLQLKADLSYSDVSVKLPDFKLFFEAFLTFIAPSVVMLSHTHNDIPYKEPLLTTDIPIQVRCFRI